ncbi:MAG TPA: VTT domain-containing protein [Polyangiaceae bacterium]|nr:VTT domain-containing protein [Polyangiaceae bacterium]
MSAPPPLTEPGREAALIGPGAPAELGVYVRRNLLLAAALLLVLFGGVGLCGVFFEAELLATTHWLYDTLGLAGLFAILFVSDAVISPVPPDLVLVVIAHTKLSASWPELLLAVSLVSVLAGNVGYWCGRRLGSSNVPRLLFGRHLERSQHLVSRYGRWAVALGALTPIPFSLTCWTAGMLTMPHPAFFSMTLLRLPRFYLYYLAIAHADRLFGVGF